MTEVTMLADPGALLPGDALFLWRGTIPYRTTVAELLAALSVPAGELLGQATTAPEAAAPVPIALGPGLAMADATLAASATDHTGLELLSAFDPTAELVVNSAGRPARMPVTQLINSGFFALVLAGLPTSDASLPTGAVWNNGGVLCVV